MFRFCIMLDGEPFATVHQKVVEASGATDRRGTRWPMMAGVFFCATMQVTVVVILGTYALRCHTWHTSKPRVAYLWGPLDPRLAGMHWGVASLPASSTQSIG